jgi:hypothetical protein
MKSLIFVSIISILVITSCKDKNISTPDENNSINPLDTISSFTGLVVPKNGSLEINLSHFYKAQLLTLNTVNYVNAANDTFNVEDLRYYFSNFSLQKQNGEWVNLKNYHLIDFKSISTHKFIITNLPAGHYKAIKYLLGIDSISNTSGLQEGALDPSWGMFWTWNSGYIFYRIMGRNPRTSRTFSFDLGGNENLPILENSLASFKLKTSNPKLYLKMDVNEMFELPFNYSFETDGYAIHTNTDAGARKLSVNMCDMVSLNRIE